MKLSIGPVAQSSAESEYNASCTAGMDLAHFRMINNYFLNKDSYVVPEQAPLIIMDGKSDVCIANNVKDTKHTRQISGWMNFVINGEE